MKTRMLLTIFLGFIVLLKGALFAEGSISSPSATPTAGEASSSDVQALLARAYAAMGCAALGKDTSITLTGLLKLPSSTGPAMRVTIHSQGNDRWRSELDTPKEHKVTVVNAGQGEIQHQDGRVTKLAQHNTFHQRPTHVPCLTNLGLPPEKLEASYLRMDTVPGDTLDVIELIPRERPSMKKLADRMKVTLWISHRTGFLIKLQYLNASEQQMDDTQPVEVAYSDYRLVDGVAVPFRQITTDGPMVLELAVDSFQMNASAADFTLRGR
jgi:hypothetical protein